MPNRFWFFWFSLFLTSILFLFETKADVEPAIWGELVQNNRYINIQVEDHGIKLHERVEMKLKKLLTDDYIFTFNTVSTNGKFDENVLRITTPATGVKDSIFDHGCELEYLSEITLEETLQVAFEYGYKYPSGEIGEIVYKRSRETSGYAYISGATGSIDIRCNRIIEVKEREYHSSPWNTIGKGTHVVVQQRPYWTLLKVCLSTPGTTDTLKDQTFFEVVPEHRRYVPNLIKNEFITIELRDTVDGLYRYHLSGTIELDLETATLFDPFYAWFPNDEINAFASMSGKFAYPGEDSSRWRDRMETLEVKPSIFEGQNGFYVLIPGLTGSSPSWPEPWGWKQATLFVKIDDIHIGNRCDFFLVTAPQEFSSVEFRIPERFCFGPCSSPFEHEATYYDNGFHVKTFYGKCLSTGIAHVAWGITPFPEDYFILSQNSPNPFNQETIIKYSLPTDCAVDLSIYNLLGQKVRTLVDQIQRADDYQVSWDGKNEQGQDVASGVYLYKLDAGWRSDGKKMVVIR